MRPLVTLLPIYSFLWYINILAVDARYNLQPVWTLAPGSTAYGGCDQHAADLADSYDEALRMAKYAVDAISIVQKPFPYKERNDNALTAAQKKQRMNWLRISQLTQFLLSVHYNRDGPVDEDGEDRLADLKGIYQKIISDSTKQNPPRDEKWRVYCTPKFLAPKKVGDDLPLQQGESQPRKVDAGEYANGLYWLGPLGADFPEILVPMVPKHSGDAETDYCPGKKLASTHVSWAAVLWCKKGLDQKVTVPAVAEGDELPDDTMSLTWLHELLHAKSVLRERNNMGDDVAIIDEPAVVSNPNTGEPALDQEGGKRAYGIVAAMYLCKYFPENCMYNADNIAMFALASYVDQWDWVLKFGDRASKLPDYYYGA